LGTRWVHLGLEQPGNASWARVLSEGTAALAVLASVHRPEQLLRVPLAQVAGEMLGAIFLLRMLPVAARPRRLAVGLGVIAPLITRSWPLVLHGLLGLAIFNSDLLFLRTLRDSAEVGYYAIAYTLISFFQNLGVNYTLSLIPSISRLRSDPRQSQQLFEGAMAQVFVGGLPVTVGGILVAASLIAFIFGPSYAPSVVPLQVLLLVVPISLFRNVAQAVLIAHERQDLMLRTVAWAAAVNVMLNILLIARWGMIGAAVATVVTEAVRTVLALHYARRLGLTMAPLHRFVRATAAAVAMAIPVWALSDRSIILSIPVGAMAFVVALWGAGGIRLQRGAWPQLTV
jgi:O-antigen/teichoic acid export membrane protein